METGHKEKQVKTYSEQLRSIHWLKRREQILNRDHNRCRNCQSDRALQIHHKQYHTFKKSGNFKRPWEYDQRYLITLCSRCHEIGHNKFKVPIFNI